MIRDTNRDTANDTATREWVGRPANGLSISGTDGRFFFSQMGPDCV